MSPVGFFCRRWLPCGKCCHLITLRLDTALIDDVGCTCAVGGVVQAPQAPAGAAGESWLLAYAGGLAPCRARLPGEGGPSLADILSLWLDLDLCELHVGSSSLFDLQSLS